ncbi:nuclear envelope morphology protein 1-like [Papaver somniferum]|uniref:nuclear envelope morphology protein 1-like n=1 Tax=Papaver somniferum TaxID=3469 RepID=UPI000E7036E0|nr:nuclear envelope morphology protein 1-like [Papaver somniferum]
MSYLEAVEPHKTASRTRTSSSSPPNKIQEQKKLLVSDLDQTLVHITISTGSLNKPCDFSFTIGERTCYVLLRPYVRKFLERVSELFDVAIFTASGRGYADPTNFCMQKDNGIPIASWYSDPQDKELSTILPFLKRLAVADDVRLIIAERSNHYRRIFWLKHLATQKLNQQEGNT